MRYSDIEIGQEVIVTTRGDGIRAIVTDKFTSKEDGSVDPAGTEFIELKHIDDKRKYPARFFNYPHQIETLTVEVDSAEGITEKQMAMVSTVRTEMARWASDPALSRALDVPITTMAQWVQPNESLMSNVRLVLTMAEQKD